MATHPFHRASVRYGDTPDPVTPYHKAAQVWDDRLGSARIQARNWRLAALATIALAVVLTTLLAVMVGRSGVIPYVVEVDRLGEVRAAGPAPDIYQPSDAQIAHFLARFVENVRSLSIDPVVVRANWLRAYDYVTDRGAQTLNEYAREADPFGKIGARTATVEVISASGLRRLFRDPLEGKRLRERRGRQGRALHRRRHHHPQAPDHARDPAEKSTRPLCPFHQLVARPHRRRQMSSLSQKAPPPRSPSLPLSVWAPARRGRVSRLPMTISASSRRSLNRSPRNRSRWSRRRRSCRSRDSSSRPRARTVLSKVPPEQAVPTANKAARIEPTRAGYINAIQVYPWTEGALYRLYTSPEKVSTIALQPAEELIDVSTGDTVRWVVADTLSGQGSTRRVHIFVKPTLPDLQTNLVVFTYRRAYHLELISTKGTYMASISWTYPTDSLIALHKQNTDRAQGGAAERVADRGVRLDSLNFRYRIEGDDPPWRPLRAFDDGHKVFIQMPSGHLPGRGAAPVHRRRRWPA